MGRWTEAIKKTVDSEPLKEKRLFVLAPYNKYGYKLNVNHPKIKSYYETYKKIKKEIILSDEERFHFEEIVIGTVKMIKNSYVM